MSQVLTVSLPTSVLYVSGTVNGIETTWTNIFDNVWETVAEKSADNVYDVELTIVGSTGITTTEKLRLYYGLNLITDRTSADVNYYKQLAEKVKKNIANAEEIAQYLAGLKGTYTANDLNRVGAAVKYVAEALTVEGYRFIPTLKTDWADADLFTAEDMANYVANIEGLRKTLAVWPNTPKTPPVVLSYVQANDIEKIIEDVDRAYQNMIAFYFCLDDLYVGEV